MVKSVTSNVPTPGSTIGVLGVVTVWPSKVTDETANGVPDWSFAVMPVPAVFTVTGLVPLSVSE